MARIKYVCASCKSDNVLLDAWAEWNEDSQRWELGAMFDSGFCSVCDGETTLETVELAPAGWATVGGDA